MEGRHGASSWASHQRGPAIREGGLYKAPPSPLSYLQEGFKLRRYVGGELDGVLDDVVDEGVDGVCVEGRLADMQLVQDDPQGPEVDLVGER